MIEGIKAGLTLRLAAERTSITTVTLHSWGAGVVRSKNGTPPVCRRTGTTLEFIEFMGDPARARTLTASAATGAADLGCPREGPRIAGIPALATPGARGGDFRADPSPLMLIHRFRRSWAILSDFRPGST